MNVNKMVDMFNSLGIAGLENEVDVKTVHRDGASTNKKPVSNLFCYNIIDYY